MFKVHNCYIPIYLYIDSARAGLTCDVAATLVAEIEDAINGRLDGGAIGDNDILVGACVGIVEGGVGTEVLAAGAGTEGEALN